MADPSNVPTSSSASKQRKVRGATKMNKISKVLKTGTKIKLNFNLETGKCYGENAADFKSYAAFLVRSKCSILIDEWPNVDKNIKDAIWVDLQKHFTIPECDNPENDPLKKKWMVILGARWREFKARLTTDYITHPLPDRPPPHIMYPFLKEETWKQFVESRNTSDFKVKSQKGRENVSKNMYRHTLSRGGYELLEKKMINEKRQLLEASGESTLSDDHIPRYETWKRARKKRGGEYISEASRVVAEKIDSLVEETDKGTFVPKGHQDILTKTIGTSEHGGRVRGVGYGATLSNYFGRSRSTIDISENLSRLETKLEAKLREKFNAEFEQKMAIERELMQQKMAEERQLMQQSIMETLKTMGFTQPSQTNQEIQICPKKVVVLGSAKGSCSAAPHSHTKESTTDNVQKLLSKVLELNDDDIGVRLEHDPFVETFWIPTKCIRELLEGDQWLDLSILQVWCTYMHRLCIERNTSNVFGILDPVNLNFTPGVKKTKITVQNYLQTRLRDMNKVCYLAPFLISGHWQLIIILPNDNTLVVLCSLHNDLHSEMKLIVTKAMAVYQLA